MYLHLFISHVQDAMGGDEVFMDFDPSQGVHNDGGEETDLWTLTDSNI